jgi:hypothetical protein
MNGSATRIFFPITGRRRNGHVKGLPPENTSELPWQTQGPHILKALGRAWTWQRRLEKGEAATVGDIAKAEMITDRFVSRTIRLARIIHQRDKSGLAHVA